MWCNPSFLKKFSVPLCPYFMGAWINKDKTFTVNVNLEADVLLVSFFRYGSGAWAGGQHAFPRVVGQQLQAVWSHPGDHHRPVARRVTICPRLWRHRGHAPVQGGLPVSPTGRLWRWGRIWPGRLLERLSGPASSSALTFQRLLKSAAHYSQNMRLKLAQVNRFI